MKVSSCTSRPWCDHPACRRPHLGKTFIVRLAVIGLLPFKFAEWLIRVFGLRSE